MTTADLHSMELDDLRKLRRDVDRAIQSYEERKKAAARAKLEDVAREMGFNLSEILETKPARARKQSAPKYRNPADPTQTWTGRGRRPGWVVEALAAGKSLDDLAIAG